MKQITSQKLLSFALLPFRLIRRFVFLTIVLILLGSFALNFALLTVSGAFYGASAALSTVGFSTVAAREAATRLTEKTKGEASERAAREASKRAAREAASARAEMIARQRVIRDIGKTTADKVAVRAQRGAVRNISSVAGESIPFIGVAVIAGALALEIKDACDTAADMVGLRAALSAETNHEAARQSAVAQFDCTQMLREKLPDYDELPSASDIWASMKDAPRSAFQKAKDAGVDVIEVDWSGRTDRVIEFAMRSLGRLGDYFSGTKD